MSQVSLRQLLAALLPLGVLTASLAPASAATFTVTESAWGDSSTVGSFAWAIDKSNATPGLDVISLHPQGGAINVGLARPFVPSSTFIGRLTDSVRIEGNGMTLQGNPTMVSSSGNVYTKTNPRKPVESDLVVENAFSFAFLSDNISVEVKDLVVDGLNGFMYVGKNAIASVSNTIFKNAVPFDGADRYNYAPNAVIDAAEGARVSLSKVVLDRVNPFFEMFGGAEFVWSGAIQAAKATLDISESIIRGPSTTMGAVKLLGGTANIVSSIIEGSSGGLSVSDLGGVDGVMNVVNSLLRFESSSTAIGRVQASSGGEANLRATTIQANGVYLSTTGGNCSVPSSDPSYLCNGSPLQAFDGGIVRLQESAISAINMDLTDVAYPYSETYSMYGTPTVGDLLADHYSYVQPTLNLAGSALRTLFDQPALLTDGAPYTLDANGFYYYPLPEGATPIGPLLSAIPDADGVNQLINPINGAVMTKDVYGNPRTASGMRDIGAVQATQVPGPLPFVGLGAAFAWSRRLRNRSRAVG